MKTDNCAGKEQKATPSKKGVKRQFSGAVLLSLGALNFMLELKAGLQFEAFNAVLLTAGVALLASGIVASKG